MDTMGEYGTGQHADTTLPNSEPSRLPSENVWESHTLDDKKTCHDDRDANLSQN